MLWELIIGCRLDSVHVEVVWWLCGSCLESCGGCVEAVWRPVEVVWKLFGGYQMRTDYEGPVFYNNSRSTYLLSIYFRLCHTYSIFYLYKTFQKKIPSLSNILPFLYEPNIIVALINRVQDYNVFVCNPIN